MQEFLIAFLIAVIVGSVVNGCSGTAPDTTTPSTSTGQAEQPPSTNTQSAFSQIADVSESTFGDEVLKSSQPVLVEFGAKWCVPCKKMAPILEQLASEYSGKLKVVKVNADENQSLAEKYTTGELPTIVVFTQGVAREKLVGEVPKERLVSLLKGFLG